MKECWYCFQPITEKYYIQHIVFKNGKNKKPVYYCSLDCLKEQIEEDSDDITSRIHRKRK